ncbi:MAG TPA: acetyl-CoA carboxylase biotin carboxylase subunit family protein [Candidatus Kapabacteria bacterium]|nr:acetyl-CoA carboxylase biotin carboxylase subunit family protein [Candidatus Kapabacteria bacterium]
MSKKVLIPNRGIIALDIIDSFKSLGFETIVLHSPEDAQTLPVKMAHRSYKFFSSRLEDSYEDLGAIIDKAIELKVDYIHPGYGFLAEEPEFARACKENNIGFIGPEHQILELVKNKIQLKELAADLGIKTLSWVGPIKRAWDFDSVPNDLKFPAIVKPVKGSGGRGIKVVEYKKDAQDQVNEMLKREKYQKEGLFIEEFFPFGHHIEIPFFRDIRGNILFLPEIESSIQRRFQKVFQESPSVNISEGLRQSIYHDSQKLIEKIDYIGLGYVEFIVVEDEAFFSEINPSYQINALIPEIHIIANFLKKQFAISTGELLHNVEGVKIVKPVYNVMLASLMAENPFDNFRPSSGMVTEFYSYSTIRNMFKTDLYAGARMSPLYDPSVGKICTFSGRRSNTINDMKNFLDNILIRGIKTNLPFLQHLLESKALARGETIIDFLNLKFDFSSRKKKEEDIFIASALLSAAFHLENREKNYKAKLEKMKQPGIFRRLFNHF